MTSTASTPTIAASAAPASPGSPVPKALQQTAAPSGSAAPVTTSATAPKTLQQTAPPSGSAAPVTTSATAETQPDPPELVAYTEHQRLRGLSPVTIGLRARTVRRFSAWLDQHRAGRSLSSARLKDLRAFVASRRDQVASASQASEISYLKSFYKGLLELGLLEQNPAVGLKSWRPHTTRRPISLVCVRALLLEASRTRGEPSARKQAVAQRDRACLELLFATGMRASEVVATRAVDLDLDEALVLVRRAKGGVSRRLPLPGPTLDALRAYLSEGRAVLLGERPDPGSLFLNRDGGELSQQCLGLLVGRVAKRAEVHAHPHAFRRTLATELVRAGVNLPAVQKVLGHAQLTMTATYVDVRLDEMRAGLEAFARDRPKCQADAGGRLPPAGLQSRLFPGAQLRAG